MKMMSKTDSVLCDCDLEEVKRRFELCIKRMKGKYGTIRAISNIDVCLNLIDDLITNSKFRRDFYQQFRNPPNTPKSRRLGWHKKGETDEQ